MRAERKSPDTIRSYQAGVMAFGKWCEAEGRKISLDPQAVEDWSNALLAAGKTAATVIAGQRGARRFSAWLARKGITDSDLIRDVKPPKLDEPVVPMKRAGWASATFRPIQILASCHCDQLA